MRILAIISIIGVALIFPVAANAEGKGQPKSQARGKVQDESTIRSKCRAETYGFGVSAAAQFRACVQRARGR
jgi:hypothetical protein